MESQDSRATGLQYNIQNVAETVRKDITGN